MRGCDDGRSKWNKATVLAVDLRDLDRDRKGREPAWSPASGDLRDGGDPDGPVVHGLHKRGVVSDGLGKSLLTLEDPVGAVAPRYGRDLDDVAYELGYEKPADLRVERLEVRGGADGHDRRHRCVRVLRGRGPPGGRRGGRGRGWPRRSEKKSAFPVGRSADSAAAMKDRASPGTIRVCFRPSWEVGKPRRSRAS